MLYSEEIFLFFGIAAENAELAGHMLRWSLPSLILYGINRNLMAFCMAQDILSIFGYSNFLAAFICFGLTGWLIRDVQVGLLVFPICAMVIEGINSVVLLYLLLFKINKETLVWVN